MKAYKIFIQDNYGFKTEEEYTSNYNKAIVILNNKVRKSVKQLKGDLATGSDFSELVHGIRENHQELLCRKEPYFLYKTKSNHLVAAIPFWEKQSYEYDEWDVVSENIVLEEIELQ